MTERPLRSSFVPAIAVAAAAVVFAACGGSDSGSDGVADVVSGPTVSADDQPAGTVRLWIAPDTVECVGEAPQTCLQVARSADGEYEWFYDSIDGFTHEVGTTYVIDVAVTEVADPPADGSSLSYRLVDIVQSSAD